MSKWQEMRNCVSGQEEYVKSWIDIVNEGEKEEVNWIKELRELGFKAAHPNDGWVNRESNKIHLAYPQFNDNVGVGDKLMLGWASEEEENIPILIIGKSTTSLGMEYLHFDFILKEAQGE